MLVLAKNSKRIGQWKKKLRAKAKTTNVDVEADVASLDLDPDQSILVANESSISSASVFNAAGAASFSLIKYAFFFSFEGRRRREKFVPL